MTIRTGIPFLAVRLVTEFNVAGAGGELVTDRTRSSGMALNAVALDTEGRLVIMACAARFPLFHLTHGGMFITSSRNKKLWMTFLTGVDGGMYLMTEFGTAGAKMNLSDGMTLLTIRCNPKGGLGIVACPARTPLFHVRHRIPRTRLTCPEDLAVAFGTFEHILVNGMAKS